MEQLGALAAQPEQYYRVLYALPWFREPALVRRSLEYAMSAAVRTQDTGTLLGMMLARPWSQETTWTFVRANWTTLLTKLGEFQGIPAIVESLGAFCSKARAQEIREFFAKNPVPSSQRGIRQSVERIESCVVLKERQQQALANWLAKR